MQNYSNHRRLVPAFHFILFALLMVIFVFTVVNLVQQIMACRAGACAAGGSCWLYSGLVPVLISVSLFFIALLMRGFSNKVQDRAIHAEENLRHFMMTGKPLDSRLTWRQIIALRFAGDDEYLALSQQAITATMSPNDIKKAIKNWRSDEHRC